MAKSRKLFVLLLALGLFYECFSLPLTTTVEENNDDDQSDAADDDDDDDQADSDAESGDDGSEGSGSKKDDVANGDDDQDDSDSDDSKPEESKKDDISNDDNNADENASDADDSSENNDEDSDDSNDDTKDEKATKKAEVPLAEEEVQDVQNANEEDSEEELTAENMGKEEERQLFKRQGGGDEHHEHHHHDHEHDHGHHEHEHEHHHHGHHHGFIHEWGQEEGGEHHGHEGHGHHEHEHEHDHEHEHEHHQHHHGHHHDGHHHHEGYGWGRSDLPMAYHCRDMISKSGDNKAVTKRFCVPIGYHNNYEVQYFHGYPGRTTQRDHIEHATKKQTVHVGYGYASGDNYRLGYQAGGMGGLASQFSNDNNDPTSESNHNGIDGRVMMNNKKSDVEKPLFRRQFNGPSNMGHGFGGHSTPYGHPVTHPGFTTMGFPGHALASTDVRNKINHPKVKRQLFNGYPQGMFAPQQPSPYGLNRAAEFQSQMDPPPGPGFPSMMGQTGEQPENLPMGMNQEEMGGRTIQRDHIERATKKQTLHIGYGYASGDNYRLGYQEGGMGGLASQFSHDNNDFNSEPDHNGIDGRVMMNNKKSNVEKPLFRRQFNGHSGMAGTRGFDGHATPFGHPVTHPGYTTMGFPGHALASMDVRNRINHPKVKRQLFNGYPQGMFAPQQPSPYGLNRAAEFQSQMDPPPGPGFPSMMGQTGEQPENMPMGMNQEEMGGSLSCLLKTLMMILS